MLNFILQTFSKTYHWELIYFGWERGWVKINEIADYATSLVEELPEIDPNLAELASHYSLDRYNIKPLLQNQITQANQHSPVDPQIVSEIWRLARLLQLQDPDLLPAEKLRKLQSIHTDFDYPIDMEDCFIHIRNVKEPLPLITTLQQKLLPFTK